MNQDSRITEDFESFIQTISLNQKEIDDIIAKHNGLTDLIKSTPPEGYKIEKTRLSGSYAKRTVLNEQDSDSIPDVDVIFIVDTDKHNPDDINNDFLNYLKEKKEKFAQTVRQQSNSIGVIYSNISVDIVIGKQGENENLFITSHKSHGWIESNALKHVDYMFNRNKEYEINYYGLMKLFKYLNKYCISSSLKSFTLEMLIHQCVPKPHVDQTLPQVFSETLSNILKVEKIQDIKDCLDIAKSAYDDKDENSFEGFKSEIKTVYEKTIEALNGNRLKWEEIFGSQFPKQPDNKAENKNDYNKNQTPWCTNEY